MSDRSTDVSDQKGNAQAQLRIFQALAALLAVILVGGAAYFFYRQRQIQAVSIVVNGRSITTVDNATEAKDLLHQVRENAAGPAFTLSGQPLFKEEAELRRVSDTASLDTDDTARTKLAGALHVTVVADVILIGNKPFVALPDKDSAQATLDAVRRHYEEMPPNDPVVDKPTFQEKVEIDRRRVPVALTKPSADEAAPLLWTAPPAQTYVVQPHETGWAIARKFHMQFADFL